MKALALLACLALTGCSTVRAVAKDWKNTDLVGEPAPALSDGEWVGNEARVEGDWYLVAFLLPW